MEKRSLGTHNGVFHADEVTACALLLLFDLVDSDKIYRTRLLEKLHGCEYVCDVGGTYSPEHKRFDHHQSDYTGEMSSAGMVWLYLKGEGFVSEALYAFVRRSLIMGVDGEDNGHIGTSEGYCSFSEVIANFIPPSYHVTDEEMEKAFFAALHFAKGHLERLFTRFEYIEGCRHMVKEVMDGGRASQLLLFEEAMPWLEAFFSMGGEQHPARFIIMPSGPHWKLRGIPPSYEKRMEVRVPLPLAWAGLLKKDLQEVSGIKGGVFCHKGRFISIWETKEDALKAWKTVIGETQ